MVLCAEHRDSPLETLRERTCLDAVGLGGNPQDRAPSLSSPVETTAVAHGGNPQDRAASMSCQYGDEIPHQHHP